MPTKVRITINGNPYSVDEGAIVHASDIRKRLLGKLGFTPLPGFDKATVYYHRFLRTAWKSMKNLGTTLLFEGGMAFQVLVKVKSKRGCKVVRVPGGVAFVCKRGS